MAFNLNNNLTLKICILLVLSFPNIAFCYSQTTDSTLLQLQIKLDESYKAMYHTLEAFNINKIDSKEMFIWKIDNKKVTGQIKFACTEQMDIASRKGIEGRMRFRHGLKHGIATIRNCQTATNYEINYKDGVKDGICRVYFESEKIRDGKLVTIDTTFYETKFVDGSGVWKDFHANGDIKDTGEYKLGKKEGEWLYYFKNNILYLRQFYENGVLLREEKIENPQEHEIQIREVY